MLRSAGGATMAHRVVSRRHSATACLWKLVNIPHCRTGQSFLSPVEAKPTISARPSHPGEGCHLSSGPREALLTPAPSARHTEGRSVFKAASPSPGPPWVPVS